jgi:hypothetical protein
VTGPARPVRNDRRPHIVVVTGNNRAARGATSYSGADL